MGSIPVAQYFTTIKESYMKLVTAVSLLALTVSPAMAWDTPPPAPTPTTINSGGNGGNASQHQLQGQQQGQKQSLSSNIQNRVSNRASSTGGTSSASASNNGSNVSVVSGGSGSGNGGGRAPDVVIPSIGGGGMDCPVVGFGVGGSGLGGGGGFGPSWISSDCNKRKVTALLSDLYGTSVARSYAEKNIDGVKEAVAAASQGNHTDPKPVRDDAWCNAVDARHQALMGRDLLDYADRCRG